MPSWGYSWMACEDSESEQKSVTIENANTTQSTTTRLPTDADYTRNISLVTTGINADDYVGDYDTTPYTDSDFEGDYNISSKTTAAPTSEPTSSQQNTLPPSEILCG